MNRRGFLKACGLAAVAPGMVKGAGPLQGAGARTLPQASRTGAFGMSEDEMMLSIIRRRVEAIGTEHARIYAAEDSLGWFVRLMAGKSNVDLGPCGDNTLNFEGVPLRVCRALEPGSFAILDKRDCYAIVNHELIAL